MVPNTHIKCGKCRFFFVTYDKKRPWGCSRFGFKSLTLPYQLVLTTTGTNCAYFKEKPFKAKKKNLLLRNERTP